MDVNDIKEVLENDCYDIVNDLADEEGVNFDLTEADGLLQIIVFGEVIYG